MANDGVASTAEPAAVWHQTLTMVAYSASLSLLISVTLAAFWPTLREHRGGISLRLAKAVVVAATVLVPVGFLAWIAIERVGSSAIAAWEYVPTLFFVPLTFGWAAGKLPWNPAYAGSRGLLFAIGIYLIVGTIVGPVIGLALGDDLAEIIDNQPATCALVAAWPLYLVWGLGLFGFGPH